MKLVCSIFQTQLTDLIILTSSQLFHFLLIRQFLPLFSCLFPFLAQNLSFQGIPGKLFSITLHPLQNIIKGWSWFFQYLALETHHSFFSPLKLGSLLSGTVLWHYCFTGLFSILGDVPSISFHIHPPRPDILCWSDHLRSVYGSHLGGYLCIFFCEFQICWVPPLVVTSWSAFWAALV